jgi:hypothetical protein
VRHGASLASILRDTVRRINRRASGAEEARRGATVLELSHLAAGRMVCDSPSQGNAGRKAMGRKRQVLNLVLVLIALLAVMYLVGIFSPSRS